MAVTVERKGAAMRCRECGRRLVPDWDEDPAGGDQPVMFLSHATIEEEDACYAQADADQPTLARWGDREGWPVR